MSFRNSGTISFVHHGDFKQTKKFLNNIQKMNMDTLLKHYAQKGVSALSSATPKDTGKTAESWDYIIEKTNSAISINWTNSNINKGVNIAVVIQYGHGTRNGGYVRGVDYINPAIRPIFEEMVKNLWKEVIE